MPKAPTLAEALAELAPNNGGPSCILCDIIPSLSAEDQEALAASLVAPRMTAVMINKAMERIGHHVPVGTIRRHRRRECAAFRT